MSLAKYGSSISEFTRRFREEGGLTQAELAKSLGVTPAYIGNVEQGRYPHPMSFCVKLRPHLDDKRKKYLDDFLSEAMQESVATRLEAIDRKRPRRGKK